MRLAIGDVIQVNSNRVGAQVRRGRVIEVLESDGCRVRVRWDDGHESSYTPSAGAVQVVPREETRSA